MRSRPLFALITAIVLLLILAGITYAQGAASRLTAPSVAQDTDGDGLPDVWELQYQLNPNSDAGDDGAGGDPDQDGLINGDEWANGANPRQADTDGDGLPDQWEIENLTDPLRGDGDFGANGDADGDGLLNKDEMMFGADPQNWDTDNDSLPDGWEVIEGIKPTDNRGLNGPDGLLSGRLETNYARFERFNDDFAPPDSHGRP